MCSAFCFMNQVGLIYCIVTVPLTALLSFQSNYIRHLPGISSIYFDVSISAVGKKKLGCDFGTSLPQISVVFGNKMSFHSLPNAASSILRILSQLMLRLDHWQYLRDSRFTFMSREAKAAVKAKVKVKFTLSHTFFMCLSVSLWDLYLLSFCSC